MSSTIQETFQKYIELQKQLTDMRKQQKIVKKNADTLELEIKEYMTKNDMDSISLKDGEIVLYARKIPQTFKKEVMMEKINERLKDSQKSEEIAQSILQNKQFIVEEKIKAVKSKKKKVKIKYPLHHLYIYYTLQLFH
jgi:DNA repair ATPase RecN